MLYKLSLIITRRIWLQRKLKIKRPRIFWTSCVAHTTNLMLQDIGKLTKFKNIIEKARALTVFIYGHTRTLALMRKCTRRKDIVRPGTTRFATSFLTLGSLLEKKDALMAMFNSDEFTSLKFVGAAKKKALTANATVISRTFWRGVRSCLKVFTPLFKFLRMVDSGTCPSMGFIIGELNQVKREIMTALKTEKDYMPIISIIERHAKNRLDSSLHLAAWFLNPLFYYAEDEVAKKSAEAKQAVLDCAELFFRNEDTIDEAVVDAIYSTELLKYRDCDAFIHGKPRAQRVVKRIAEDRNPAHWWDTFGGDMPYMQMMALRILRLTGSSSGCERNWSCFEGIHTKKRNRLDSKRLSDLVYVQFNLRIRTKMDTTRKDGKKRDILLAKDGRHASAWVVDGYNSEEEEDYYPGTDIPLGVISEAAGTDEFLQPRRTTRRANMASSSRANEEVDSEDEEEGRNDESDSDEEDIQLDDDDSDEDALRDEILLLGTAADDDDDE
ncbi:uncharacterized protein LOC109843955 [Asparagus officinalis]|uniref:uncharacterized protein LOC109843955 n=1 Tax=Asparagus officinalis TaxID=4686 RepID=UPI00098E32B1|nr:uncharacterized protein LOC109843955 [Asparagus officinalis]